MLEVPLAGPGLAAHLPLVASSWEYNMRSRQRGWIMPEEDIPSMLRMIEEKIASSEIEVDHRHALIRLRDMLEGDLHRVRIQPNPNVNREASQEAA